MPTAPWAGPARVKLAVVSEDFEGVTSPMSGPAGLGFRALLEEANIPVQKCGFAYPHSELAGQLLEHGPTWVILSGDDALHAVRPDLDQGLTHGRPFQWSPSSGVICFPVFHYVSLLRDHALRAVCLAELKDLRSIAKDPPSWKKFAGDTCVRCRGEMHSIDGQGVVYCKEHWRG